MLDRYLSAPPTLLERLAFALSTPNNRIEEILAVIEKVDRIVATDNVCSSDCQCRSLGKTDLLKDLEDIRKEGQKVA
jgi:hypothetical protein